MDRIETSVRDNAIDVMKGFITLLMVLSHSMHFAGISQSYFSHYVNLTTFSGFMFCFGYVCNMAYLQKKDVPWKKLVKGGIRLYIAYNISALMYLLLIDHNLNKNTVTDLLFQRWIAGYSEFLLSWAYLYFILVIIVPMLRSASNKKYSCLGLVLISLCFTFIDYDIINISWLGPIVGYKSAHYFPLVQYFSYFLIGCYFNQQKREIKFSFLLVSFLCSMAFFVYYISFSKMPRRWGPSFLWVVGGYFFIYVYYVAVKKLTVMPKVSGILSKIGQNTLLYLLVNNICCFTSYNILPFVESEVYLFNVLLFAVTLGCSIAISEHLCKLLNVFKKHNETISNDFHVT